MSLHEDVSQLIRQYGREAVIAELFPKRTGGRPRDPVSVYEFFLAVEYQRVQRQRGDRPPIAIEDWIDDWKNAMLRGEPVLDTCRFLARPLASDRNERERKAETFRRKYYQGRSALDLSQFKLFGFMLQTDPNLIGEDQYGLVNIAEQARELQSIARCLGVFLFHPNSRGVLRPEPPTHGMTESEQKSLLTAYLLIGFERIFK